MKEFQKATLLQLIPETEYGIDAANGPDLTAVIALPIHIGKAVSLGTLYGSSPRKLWGHQHTTTDEVIRQMRHAANRPELKIFLELGTTSEENQT